MKKLTLQQIIEGIKAINPYPLDIFPEPSDEDWKDVGKFLQEHGRNPNLIFAKWGRMVWNNCINCMEDYIEDCEK